MNHILGLPTCQSCGAWAGWGSLRCSACGKAIAPAPPPPDPTAVPEPDSHAEWRELNRDRGGGHGA